MFNEIFVFHCGGRFAHAAPSLRCVIAQWLSFRIARFRNSYHTVFFCYQVFDSEVLLRAHNLSAALIAVFVAYFF